MKVSAEGLEHLASFEGLSLKLYNDPAGNCTIGVGRLVHVGPCNGAASERPYRGGVTRAQAYVMLAQDVARFERCVEAAVSVPLNQNQFDALVSFAYNIGCGGLQASTVLAAVNAKRFGRVCPELRRYVRGNDGVTYPGLVRRREAECTLFNTPVSASPELEGYDVAGFMTIDGGKTSYLVTAHTRQFMKSPTERAQNAKALGISPNPTSVSKATLERKKLIP